MPRFTAEKARSPERIPYHLRSKPATPIEIPRRRRLGPSPLNSPMEPSPELIFEMSPISSSFPMSSTIYPISSPPSNDLQDQPFMYNIPVFRSHGVDHATWPRQKPSRQSVAPPREPTIAPTGTHKQPRRTSVENKTSEMHDSARVVAIETEWRGAPRRQATTKITGFCPINVDQLPTSDETPILMERLSPPPRRASYFPSPWILPGRNECCEDDLSYSLTDPSAFEFQRHLLRRIENKDSSRFASLRSCL